MGEIELCRPTGTKAEKYRVLREWVTQVLGEEQDPVAWMATFACLAHEAFGFLWIGFYRLVEGELVVGPYQGSLGCLRISVGKGVCGTAAARKETVVVEDVEAFPGHIRCDSRSRSEIVVPVLDRSGEVRAVLDVDSEVPGAFDETDRTELELILLAARGLPWAPTS